jgi:hypothetical protein
MLLVHFRYVAKGHVPFARSCTQAQRRSRLDSACPANDAYARLFLDELDAMLTLRGKKAFFRIIA